MVRRNGIVIKCVGGEISTMIRFESLIGENRMMGRDTDTDNGNTDSGRIRKKLGGKRELRAHGVKRSLSEKVL